MKIRCPKCRAAIIHKSLDGKVKIRTTMVVVSPTGTEVVCRQCGADVPIDLTLGEGLRKSLFAPQPVLVVRQT